MSGRVNSVTAEGPPVFICGVGRSGTSLIQAALNAHTDICLPPESHFLRRYVSDSRRARRLRRGGARGLARILAEDRFASRLQLTVDDVVGANDTGHTTPADFYKLMMKAVARRKGKPRWGDKDPRLLECLDAVSRFFPQARVVHVVRDPRDVVASRLRADWANRWPRILHPFVYRSQIGTGALTGMTLLGERFLEVRYEDILTDPSRELTRICQHAGLDYQPGMLSFHRQAAELISEGEMQWKSNILQPLQRANSGRWEKELSDHQVALVEAVCRRQMAHYGYETSGAVRRLPAGQRLLVRCAAGIAPFFDYVYSWRR